MARMPGARWRPIQRNYTGRRTTKTRVILHTTASASATSMHGWFSNPNAGASSHFHIDNAGNIEQYIDTDYISWANRDGNSDSVTIETQGAGHEPWTNAQIVAIVQIIQWARTVHKGIPLRQMTSSHPSQKGIGWHRLGVNGNFPRSGILRGRQQRGGGELWSAARGKVCPGDKRIQQIPGIIRQSNGHTTPEAPPTRKSWFDMASLADLRKAIAEARIEVTRGGKKTTRELGTLVANLDTHAVPKEHVAEAVLDARVPVKRGGGTSNLRLGTLVAGQDAARNRQAGRLSALEEIVSQLATGQGVTIDYDRVEQAAKTGAAAAIEEAAEDEGA